MVHVNFAVFLLWDFISLHERMQRRKKFEFARILISTSCMEFIHMKVAIDMGESKFHITVIEDIRSEALLTTQALVPPPTAEDIFCTHKSEFSGSKSTNHDGRVATPRSLASKMTMTIIALMNLAPTSCSIFCRENKNMHMHAAPEICSSLHGLNLNCATWNNELAYHTKNASSSSFNEDKSDNSSEHVSNSRVGASPNNSSTNYGVPSPVELNNNHPSYGGSQLRQQNNQNAKKAYELSSPLLHANSCYEDTLASLASQNIHIAPAVQPSPINLEILKADLC
ncbi:hypothetical protein GH714_021962 [Hevea brasiliensis]|uniref:Uncharacterized protein n=1 Tax=Hevea brasiliensis TaxID=3981 RepID=A0A6A6LAQ1_HEVBR|nr:hypothetical protein GH714_021962 [Hevea brasiliensis]